MRRRAGERPPRSRVSRVILSRLPGLALALILPLAAAYLYLHAFPAHHTATTAVFADGEAGGAGSGDSRWSHLELATSRPVIDRVVRQPELTADIAALRERGLGAAVSAFIDRVRGLPPPQPDLAARLQAAISARPAAEANVLEITARAADGTVAARLANAVAAAFVAEVTALSPRSGAQPAPGSASNRSADFRRRIAEAEANLAAARSRASANATPAAGGWDQLERELAEGRDIAALAARIPAPGVTRLAQDYADAAAQEANLRTSLGARHPSVVEARQQLEEKRKILTESVRLAIAAGKIGAPGVGVPRNQADETAEPQRALARIRAEYEAYQRSPDGQADQQQAARNARVLRPAVAGATSGAPQARTVWTLALLASAGLGLLALLRMAHALFRLYRDWVPATPARGQRRDTMATAPLAEADPDTSGLAATPDPAAPHPLRGRGDDRRVSAEGVAEEISVRAETSALQTWLVTGGDGVAVAALSVNVAAAAARRHLRVILLDANEKNPILSKQMRDAPVSGHIMLNGRRRPLASIEPRRGAPVWLAPALASLVTTADVELPLVVPGLAGHFDLMLIVAPELGSDTGEKALAAAAETVVCAAGRAPAHTAMACAEALGIAPEKVRLAAGDPPPKGRSGHIIRLDLA